jgi:hypothetical protein
MAWVRPGVPNCVIFKLSSDSCHDGTVGKEAAYAEIRLRPGIYKEASCTSRLFFFLLYYAHSYLIFSPKQKRLHSYESFVFPELISRLLYAAGFPNARGFYCMFARSSSSPLKEKQLTQLWMFLSLLEFLAVFQNRPVAMPCPGEQSRASKLQKCNSMDA